MSARSRIIRECDRANIERRVCRGRMDYHTFFSHSYGALLISGVNACSPKLLIDMLKIYRQRQDMSTIVLTSHLDFLNALRMEQDRGCIDGVMISSPDTPNYHLMYGMSDQQVLDLIKLTGEELRCTGLMDQVLLYAASLINIVVTRYPVSFPAVCQLLNEDDDFIAEFALRQGISNVAADNILGNHEAGIMLRRIIQYMDEVFSGVALSENDTKYNFQSGSKGQVPIMAFYQPSRNQKIMNTYLKEELYDTLKRVPKIRVVADETVFTGESDELLVSLTQMKRQGKVELIVCSENAKEMLCGKWMDFGNVCILNHASSVVTEEISKDLLGTFQYHYPVCVSGKPPAVFYTIKQDIHWHIATEERLRVRAEDLYQEQVMFGQSAEKLAVRLANDKNVYIISAGDFFAKATNESHQEVMHRRINHVP